MDISSRKASFYIRRIMRPFVRSNDSSRQIAGGIALGVLVAFSPTMGLQMLIAALLTTALGCSRLPALAAVYITNPFTAIPIYIFCYVVGVQILKPFGFTLDMEQITRLLVRPEDLGFWETIYHKLGEVFALGWNAFAPLWLGCISVGTLAAILAYYISLRFVTGHRLIKAEKMARRAQKRLERIQMMQTLEQSRLRKRNRDE